MKHLLIILFSIFTFSLLITNCEEEHEDNKEKILYDLNGFWNIYEKSNNIGNITFNKDDESLTIYYSTKSSKLYGDYSAVPDTITDNYKEIYISEILEGDNDYEFKDNISQICPIKFISNRECKITGLPYYETTELTLKK